MTEGDVIRSEAEEALRRVWFIQSIEEEERSDISLSLRLAIRPGLFVQVFVGERSGSLYMALIEGKRRISGSIVRLTNGIRIRSTSLRNMNR